MHPQSSDKKIGKLSVPSALLSRLISTTACRDFFEALELCHANVWAKWTGGCNQAKRELNKCLHKEVTPLFYPRQSKPFMLILSHV
jgi:hypothetical protein